MFFSNSERFNVLLRGLQPGCTPPENSSLMIPVRIPIFANEFAHVEGRYPDQDIRLNGLVNPDYRRWSCIANWVLTKFEDKLHELNLYEAIYSTVYGFAPNPHLFLALAERYNYRTGTFMTPCGEIGLALHEMQFLSCLPMGDNPYEEYVPTNDELDRLRKENPVMIAAFEELLCHYNVCTLFYKSGTSGTCYLSKWLAYLFLKHIIEKKAKENDCNPDFFHPLNSIDVVRLKEETGDEDTKIEDNHQYPPLKKGDTLESCLNLGYRFMSKEAQLAGFIAYWLRRFVVPGSSAVDRFHRGVLFAAVRLVFGYKMDLLSAMTCKINASLRLYVESMLKNKGEKDQFPRLELPYTYLFGWLLLHHPSLMDPDMGPVGGNFLRKFSKGNWKYTTLTDCRLTLNIGEGWIFFCTPPPDGYDQMRLNMTDSNMHPLSRTAFDWLKMIRPAHLVYRFEEKCYLEPYLPSRFARQFGYDQFHVGNAFTSLQGRGFLIDGARAWAYYNARDTKVIFSMPSNSTQGPRMLHTYSQFYTSANTFAENFNLADSFASATRLKKGKKVVSIPGNEEVHKPMDPLIEVSRNIIFPEEVNAPLLISLKFVKSPLKEKKRKGEEPLAPAAKKKLVLESAERVTTRSQSRQKSDSTQEEVTTPTSVQRQEIVNVESPPRPLHRKKLALRRKKPFTASRPVLSSAVAGIATGITIGSSIPTPEQRTDITETRAEVSYNQETVKSPPHIMEALETAQTSKTLREEEDREMIAALDGCDYGDYETTVSTIVALPKSDDEEEEESSSSEEDEDAIDNTANPDQIPKEMALEMADDPSNPEKKEMAAEEVTPNLSKDVEEVANIDDTLHANVEMPRSLIEMAKEGAAPEEPTTVTPQELGSSSAHAICMDTVLTTPAGGNQHLTCGSDAGSSQAVMPETTAASVEVVPAADKPVAEEPKESSHSPAAPLFKEPSVRVPEVDPSAPSSSSGVAATPGVIAANQHIIGTFTRCFFDSLGPLVTRVMEKEGFDIIRTPTSFLIKAIRAQGDEGQATFFEHILDELEAVTKSYRELNQGNAESLIQAEFEKMSQEAALERVKLQTFLDSFTARSAEYNSKVEAVSSVTGSREKKINDLKTEITRLQQELENEVAAYQVDTQQLDVLVQERDEYTAAHHVELTRRLVSMPTSDETAMMEETKRLQALKQQVANLIRPPV